MISFLELMEKVKLTKETISVKGPKETVNGHLFYKPSWLQC